MVFTAFTYTTSDDRISRIRKGAAARRQGQESNGSLVVALSEFGISDVSVCITSDETLNN